MFTHRTLNPRMVNKPRRGRLLVALALTAVLAGDGAPSTLTLTTIYPAPSGVYKNMVVTQLANLARDAGGQVGIGLGTWPPNASAKLDVEGTGTVLLNSGNVGIGRTTPIAALDVNGAIRPGSGGVAIGGSCSPEGALAYDIGAHAPVYCNQAGTWGAMGSSLQVTAVSTAYAPDLWNPGYGPWVSCPAGYSLLFADLIALTCELYDVGWGTPPYCYGYCQTSGNSLRAIYLNQPNASLVSQCIGLCTK